jgi:hypothetical protein
VQIKICRKNVQVQLAKYPVPERRERKRKNDGMEWE